MSDAFRGPSEKALLSLRNGGKVVFRDRNRTSWQKKRKHHLNAVKNKTKTKLW